MSEILNFNTILQWFSKSQQIYNLDSIKDYDYESFWIEQYRISFIKEGDVVIEIAMDLKDMAKRLYQNENEQEDWIKDQIKSTIQVLKTDLKTFLPIIRRSKRTNTISVFFKSWMEEILAIIIFEK